MKITINGNIREFSHESMTADKLVVELKLTGKRFAIERNGEIMIHDGDYLEIVGAVGGG